MRTWRYIEDDQVSDTAGLAVDEFLMASPGPVLRLYTYRSHCALVGKFQNVEAEINTAFCRDNRIPINRRPTGGGAIIMGEDQLGIAVIDSSRRSGVPEHPKEIFALYGSAIIAGLEQLRIRGGLEAKNDIRVNGRKIAGLGVCRNEQGNFLFHASLMVDLDVDLMLRVLKIPAEKLTDKLRARVSENLTTVRRETGGKIGVAEVRAAIQAGFAKTLEVSFQRAPLSAEELQEARKLEAEKYLQPSWIFQRVPTPDMNGTSVRKTAGGLVRIYVSVAGERIKDITITGDFISDSSTVLAMEKALSAIPASEEGVSKAVAAVHHVTPLDGVEIADLVPAVMEAVAEARRMSSQPGPYGCFVDPRERANEPAE